MTAVLALMILALRPIDPPLDQSEFEFYDVNVVPMDRPTILPMFSVIVRDGQISEMHPSDLQHKPSGRFIDGRGEMYLLPGLSDMHFHLYYAGDLLSLLANGVTTIRNMRGRQSDLDFRKKIRDGELPGPTIFTAGPILGGPNDDPPHLKIANARQAIEAIRLQHEQGYDFVKIYDGLPRDAYYAGIKEAHSLGMQFVGHIPESVGADGAVEAHQDSLEHMEEFVYRKFDKSMDETVLPAFARKVSRSGCDVCPTIGLIHDFTELADSRETLLTRPEMRFANPEVRSWWASIKRDSSGQNRLIAYFQAKMLKSFSDAGVRLLSGTDTHSVGLVPGFSLHREFGWMIDAGLSPYQVLESSTASPGRFLNRKTGIVRPGFQADLLLVKRNPLESIEALRFREGVMVRGKWRLQAELDHLMEDLVASYKGK